MTMEEQNRAAAEEATAEQDAPPAAPVEHPPAEETAPADPPQPEPTNSAAEIADLCVLAGFPGRIAGFLRSGATIADVRAELTKARAEHDEETHIQSHVLPETGAAGDGLRAKTAVTESPIVRAAEKLANEGKKE